MKISKEFGPQFDPADGTIGTLQLVRRWLICSGEGMFYPRQGRYSWESWEKAADIIDSFKDNPANAGRLPAGLRPVAYWCYPGHFDPVGPCAHEEEP